MNKLIKNLEMPLYLLAALVMIVVSALVAVEVFELTAPHFGPASILLFAPSAFILTFVITERFLVGWLDDYYHQPGNRIHQFKRTDRV